MVLRSVGFVVLLSPPTGVDRDDDRGQLAMSFRVSLEYSNIWNEQNISWEKMDLDRTLSAAPFFVEAEFDGKVSEGKSTNVKVRAVSVRYNRGRGETRWGFEAKKKNAHTEQQLREICRDLAIESGVRSINIEVILSMRKVPRNLWVKFGSVRSPRLW